MTDPAVPSDPGGSEGDSEKKKWGYKRQQFDAVISTTRFNGAIDNLVSGAVEVRALLGILDELNTSNQRGRYMAEVLALKQESRRLATAPFDKRVAEFLIEGSRRIPFLSDGLASQMAVALASAADNLSYLDTVNAAVSNLLLDLDRPLKADTRNYLRALTDKIDATRRLQEARGYLATVPSVYPPVIPDQLANAKSPAPSAVELRERLLSEAEGPDDEATQQIEKQQVLAVGDSASKSDDDYEEENLDLEPTELKPGPKFTSQRTLMMPVSAVPPAKRTGDSGSHRAPTKLGATATEASPTPAEAQTPSKDRAVLEGAVTVLADAIQAHEVDPTAGKGAAPPRPAAAAGHTAASPATPRKTRIAERITDRPVVAGHGPMPVPSRRPPRFIASSRPQRPDSGLGDASTTAPGIGDPSKPTPESTRAHEAITDSRAGQSPQVDAPESMRIPTRSIPVWVMVIAAGGLLSAAAAAWVLLRGSGPSDEAAPTASASASAAAAGSAVKTTKNARTKGAAKLPASAAPPAAEPPAAVPAPPPAAPPAPPPVAAQPAPPPAAAVPPAPPAKANPTPLARTPVRTPAPPSKPVHVAAPPQPSKPPKPEPTPAPTPPKANATAAAPTAEPPIAPTTPKPSRTIDDILLELLQIPNDPASIEAKAHEVARIVARTTRADAEHILQRLIPEEVLAGTETVDTRALEPVRRVVALLLKKVALDKDDNRAAMAIDSLGEWAKLRKHGAAAKLTLDELAESPVILSRPKRLHALERVQARLGISNVGE